MANHASRVERSDKLKLGKYFLGFGQERFIHDTGNIVPAKRWRKGLDAMGGGGN